MKKLISSLSGLMILGYGAIFPTSVKANSSLLRCFYHLNKPPAFEISGKAFGSDFDYYIIKFSGQFDSYTNVIKIARNGSCQIAVEQQQISIYPLSNFLDPVIAHELLTSRYSALIEKSGGQQGFINALVDELDAASPHIFFEDEVKVLKELGIDLEKITSYLVVVGEEGIPGHPELQFKE